MGRPTPAYSSSQLQLGAYNQPDNEYLMGCSWGHGAYMHEYLVGVGCSWVMQA